LSFFFDSHASLNDLLLNFNSDIESSNGKLNNKLIKAYPSLSYEDVDVALKSGKNSIVLNLPPLSGLKNFSPHIF
jgi:hypothetical protein